MTAHQMRLAHGASKRADVLQRTKSTRRPFAVGDKVIVAAGPDRHMKGKIVAVDLDQRGLRVSRVMLDTEFGACVRWLFNADLRRTS